MSNSMTWFGLERTTCVIAGAGGLIGRASTRALDECGAKVFALDNRREFVGPGQFTQIDVTQPDQLAAFFATLRHEEGREWAFINCAYPRTENWGTLGFQNVSFEAFTTNVQMQLGSTFVFSQEAVKFLERSHATGTIINLGSTYGMVGPDLRIYDGTPMQNPSPYAAVKGGVVGLTRYIATVCGSKGIRANVLCPGGILDQQPESFRRAYEARTPLGRMGTPEDIAGVVAFLAGPSARYITGQVIAADGGWTAW